MRLLSTGRNIVRDFISDDDVPKYAILSHTWQPSQEVSFQQWKDRDNAEIRRMSGLAKIEQFRAQAARDGFEWIWVDTCCIDKTSSAELSEAINAMFRWYQNAATCYVYLSDVSSPGSAEAIASSRWFTRGWTLQELIAPKEVRFYSADWQFLDTKVNLSDLLFSITNIDTYILYGGDLETVSIARRMSWLSRRKTSRIEDMAYCLLGIFDVNLPLIYGEGRRAFQRLQEAIMLKTHDQSLFAWGKLVDFPSNIIDEDQYFGLSAIQWESPKARQPLLGLFAEGPEMFEFSSEIAPFHTFSHELRRTHPPAILSGGVLLGLVTANAMPSAVYFDRPALAVPTKIEIAVLLCRIGNTDNKLVGLALHRWGEGYSARTPELVVLNMSVSTMRFRGMIQQHHILRARTLELHNGDIVFRRHFTPQWGIERCQTLSGPGWRPTSWGSCQILRLASDALGHEWVRHYYHLGPFHGVAASFKRLAKSASTIGRLIVEISPIKEGEGEFPPFVAENITLKHGRVVQNRTHVMEIPFDSWNLETDGLPCISIRVERMDLGDGSNGAVDIVDFVIRPDEPERIRERRYY